MAHNPRPRQCWPWLLLCSCALLLTVDITMGQAALQNACELRVPTETPRTTGCHYCLADMICKCCGQEADCSGHDGNLTFVPELPDNVRFLNFSHNRLGDVSVRDNFLQNVTRLTALDLSANRLRDLPAMILQNLTNLTWLCLQENPDLRSMALPSTFRAQRLEYLSIMMSELRIMSVMNDLFSPSSVKRLHITVSTRSNPSSVALDFLATHFRVLEDFSMSSLADPDTLATSIDDPWRPSSLQTLDLNSLGIETFPRTCASTGSDSLFPFLSSVNFSYNRISSLPHVVCLPALEVLDLTSTRFHILTQDAFGNVRFPALSVLILRTSQPSLSKIDRLAFQNRALTKLSLQNQGLRFGRENVDPDSFGDCPNLIELDLSGNNFNGVVNDKYFQELLRNVSNLQSLHMDQAHVDEINDLSFSEFKSLRLLTLTNNTLTALPAGFLDGLTNLTEVDLRDNRLAIIREGTFDTATLSRLGVLDLRGNPLICSCDSLWLRDWLRNRVSDTSMTKSFAGVKCSNTPDVKLIDLDLDYQACLARPWVYKVLLAFAVLFVSGTSAVILFRLRKRIRLAFQTAFWRHKYRDLLNFHHGRNRKPRLQVQQEQQNIHYDLYVSYASEDEDWVLAYLIPEAEVRMGLKLCIHERDFILGEPIIGNIVACMEGSKKIMMLFSKAFAESEWCQYELTLALNYVMDRDESLVVVILEDVDQEALSPAMKAVLSTFTYIEWDKEPFVQTGPTFWDRLQAALQDAETQV